MVLYVRISVIQIYTFLYSAFIYLLIYLFLRFSKQAQVSVKN